MDNEMTPKLHPQMSSLLLVPGYTLFGLMRMERNDHRRIIFLPMLRACSGFCRMLNCSRASVGLS